MAELNVSQGLNVSLANYCQELGVEKSTILKDSWHLFRVFSNRGIDRSYVFIKDGDVEGACCCFENALGDVQKDANVEVLFADVSESDLSLYSRFSQESGYGSIEKYTQCSLAFILMIFEKLEDGWSFAYKEGDVYKVSPLFSGYEDRLKIAYICA